MATRRPNRDPRYRRRHDGPLPALSPEQAARLYLAGHPTCQWQARGVRCVAEAATVVRSRERVLRSSCAAHLPAWLRTGARPA